MRVLISAEGKHDPEKLHYMVVDNHGLLIDLAGIGTLTDPTIRRVEWGPHNKPGERQPECGVIVRQDGSQQAFFDSALLAPYLTAFELRRLELVKIPEAADAPSVAP